MRDPILEALKLAAFIIAVALWFAGIDLLSHLR